MRLDRIGDWLFDVFLRLIGSAILTVFVSLGIGFVAHSAFVSAPLPFAEGLVRERLAAETQVATELGFSLDRTLPVTERNRHFDVDVAAGECLALVGGIWGGYEISGVVAVKRGTPVSMRADQAWLASDADRYAVVAHAQGCSDRDRTLTVSVESRRRVGETGDPVTGELRVLRAPRAQIGTLNRGFVLREASAASSADAEAPADAGR